MYNSEPKFSISSNFVQWLEEQHIALAFTTYFTGKLYLIGIRDNKKLSIYECSFDRVMGLYATPEQLIVSSRFQLWKFENVLEKGQLYNGHDCLYIPRDCYITGDLYTHDIALDTTDQIIFVNTSFSCLATVNNRDGFLPLWHPPFISKIIAEDRCHLNGLAMQEGKPHYVTCLSPMPLK